MYIAAGVAGFVLITGVLAYISYSIGAERAAKKWKAEYSKLYRTCLIELMHAYSGEGVTHKIGKKEPNRTTSSDGNIIKFIPKREKDDSKG